MENLVYLDNAATTWPKPREVLDFMVDFYHGYGVNPGRSGFDLALQAEEMLVKTRRRMQAFFNGKGDFNRLIFSYNATDALNTIILGLLKEGDHAISTTVEHNSVLRPLYLLATEGGVDVDHVPFDGKGFCDPDEFRKRIRPNTRLVIMNHGSNVIGTIQPVAEVGRICREKGITFAIDASQTAGMLPIDMEEMCIDVVAFTGHKSLLGPTGIGGLYVREGIEIHPSRYGGTGVASAVRGQPDLFPHRLECGTVNLAGVAGLWAAQNFLEKRGIDNIAAHEHELASILREGLAATDGVTLYCGDSMENHLPVLAFNIEGYEAFDAGSLLDVDHDIAVRTGLHCAPLVHKGIGTFDIHGSLRASVGPFTTKEDVLRCLEAVRQLVADKR
jgi:cysteine desulfurase / selenocysteine lyase